MATLSPFQIKLYTVGADGQTREMTFDEIAKMMNALTFEEYQKRAMSTAVYPACGVHPDSPSETVAKWIYPCIGLSGEVGEISEKVKKIIRDKGGVATDDDRLAIAKEIGDALWYLAALSQEFGITMHHAAQMNLDKLASRKERGVLGGSGDER